LPRGVPWGDAVLLTVYLFLCLAFGGHRFVNFIELILAFNLTPSFAYTDDASIVANCQSGKNVYHVVKDDKEQSIAYTYSVAWVKSNVEWKNRWRMLGDCLFVCLFVVCLFGLLPWSGVE
jgi:hypothetical protein